jgi:GNAT superfamily N-acetyltransferase
MSNVAASGSRRFAIVFAPATAKRVSNYVVRGFFGPRELPQALARMLLTREFALFVGIPILLLIAARAVAGGWPGGRAGMLSFGLTGAAVAWLIAGLLRISRYGPSRGIGCYLVEPDGSRGPLVGGLRMRLERRRRRVWIAGLLVEPPWRGAGISTALMQAAFCLAHQEASSNGPVTLAVFAPAHPASRAIIARHLGGSQIVHVTDPPGKALQQVIESLGAAQRKSGSEFQWSLDAERGLFRRRRIARG